MYTVYLHTLPDGKIYIGQTSEPYKRWGGAINYKNNKDFYKAIQEVGWENVKHDILAECDSEEEALEKESMFIVMLNAENKKVGYNKTHIKKTYEDMYLNRKRIEKPEDLKPQEKINRHIGGGIFDGRGLSRKMCENIINEWIFNDKHKRIYTLKQLHGYTYQQVADAVGMSVRQTKNIVYYYNDIISKQFA